MLRVQSDVPRRHRLRASGNTLLHVESLMKPTRRALAVAVLVMACARGCLSGAPEPAGVGPHTHERPQSLVWTDVGAASADGLIADVSRRVDDARLPDADRFKHLFSATINLLLLDDVDTYLSSCEAIGATPDRQMMLEICADWRRWGFGPPEEPHDLPDDALFIAMMRTKGPRLMQLRALDPDDVAVAHTIFVVIGKDPWPYVGARGQLSTFMPVHGRLARDRAEEIDGTSETLAVTVGVIYGDGSPGHLRMHFFHEPGTGHWFPLTIGVGSTGERWPFPLW